MRISLWPVLVCGLVLAGTVGQTTRAAEPADRFSEFAPAYDADGDGDDSDLYEAPAGYSEENSFAGPYFQPVQYVEDGSGGMPAYGMDPYAAQGYPPNAWPNVSPYDHRMQGVVNDGSLWQYNESDEERIWLGSVEFLIAWGLRPGTQLIGAGGPPSDQYFFPNGNHNIFPHQTTNEIPNIKHYGVRARYGWENPDGSGFIASGFYAAEAHDSAGPVGVHQFPLGSTIQNVASIPYSVGNGGGELMLFDLDFKVRYGQEVWGSSVDYFQAPFFVKNKFKLGVTFGAEYLGVNESLNIRAQNSNLAYIIDNFGVITNVINNGFSPLDTQINAWTKTNLVGPTAGFKYELGGKKFKIWGQTKFGVMANMEEMRVYGQDAIGFTDVITNAFFNDPVRPLTFSTTRSHTHVSPLIDQSIFGEFPLFAMLPLFNKVSLINRANFRIGWNFIYVAEMSRPANIIQYNLREPTIRTNRSWFSLSTLSFAIDWRF